VHTLSLCTHTMQSRLFSREYQADFLVRSMISGH